MELKHLRYFRTAVDEGSLQAAAARLNVAQPALSRRVRDLEALLGCDLLVRGARGVVPTRAGLALYRDTVRLFGDLDEAVQRARRLGLEQGRGVRMGKRANLESHLNLNQTAAIEERAMAPERPGCRRLLPRDPAFTVKFLGLTCPHNVRILRTIICNNE